MPFLHMGHEKPHNIHPNEIQKFKDLKSNHPPKEARRKNKKWIAKNYLLRIYIYIYMNIYILAHSASSRFSLFPVIDKVTSPSPARSS
jgi:hypothetical protein